MNPSALALLIAAQPGLAERIRQDHADDGSGRCRRCPIGGQSGFHRWPCRLYELATASVRIVRSQP